MMSDFIYYKVFHNKQEVVEEFNKIKNMPTQAKRSFHIVSSRANRRSIYYRVYNMPIQYPALIRIRHQYKHNDQPYSVFFRWARHESHDLYFETFHWETVATEKDNLFERQDLYAKTNQRKSLSNIEKLLHELYLIEIEINNKDKES